ncbi:MAG: hypothetical protein LBN18_05190 [Dysgonamonadaceae bacterium]|jgi:hypothetical protein|nr:hypothetical protein [Dysgonamonadaceae bacterium]
MSKGLTKPDDCSMDSYSVLRDGILDHLVDLEVITLSVVEGNISVDLDNHKNVFVRAIWRSGKNLLVELSDQYVISINNLNIDNLKDIYNYLTTSAKR